MARWQDKLTKKELKHLRKSGDVTTLTGARKLAEFQAQKRAEYPGCEPCYECKTIMYKLGLVI